VSRWILACLSLVLLAGCGSSAPTLDTGRGLYAAWSPERLKNEGYPGSSAQNYSSSEWGLLYDEQGISYGPKSFYEGRNRLEHEYLEITEEYLQSRWIRIPRSSCCTEPLLGHYLEICDLAWKDLTTQLKFVPAQRINIYSPEDMDGYYAVTGTDFAQTFVVSANTVILQPIDILFRRTLEGHAAYAAIGESLIEMETHGAAPHWLQTGLASYLAQEGFEHLSFVNEFRPTRGTLLLTPKEVMAGLVPFASRETGRIARYNAFIMAWYLSENYGFGNVIELLARLGEGVGFAAAVEQTYGVDVDTLLAAIDPSLLGEPTTIRPGY
jgi:hypothetical protein